MDKPSIEYESRMFTFYFQIHTNKNKIKHILTGMDQGWNLFPRYPAISECKLMIEFLQELLKNNGGLIRQDYQRSLKAQRQLEYETLYAKSNKSNEPKQPRHKLKGYIYILKDGNFFKIGKSKNPHNRFIALRKMNPTCEFMQAHKTNDMAGNERALHEKFKNKRGVGEWFQLTTKDLLYIKQKLQHEN